MLLIYNIVKNKFNTKQLKAHKIQHKLVKNGLTENSIVRIQQSILDTISIVKRGFSKNVSILEKKVTKTLLKVVNWVGEEIYARCLTIAEIVKLLDLGKLLYDSAQPRVTWLNSAMVLGNLAAAFFFIYNTNHSYVIKVHYIFDNFLISEPFIAALVLLMPVLLFFKSRVLFFVYFFFNGNIAVQWFKILFNAGMVDDVLKNRWLEIVREYTFDERKNFIFGLNKELSFQHKIVPLKEEQLIKYYENSSRLDAMATSLRQDVKKLLEAQQASKNSQQEPNGASTAISNDTSWYTSVVDYYNSLSGVQQGLVVTIGIVGIIVAVYYFYRSGGSSPSSYPKSTVNDSKVAPITKSINNLKSPNKEAISNVSIQTGVPIDPRLIKSQSSGTGEAPLIARRATASANPSGVSQQAVSAVDLSWVVKKPPCVNSAPYAETELRAFIRFMKQFKLGDFNPHINQLCKTHNVSITDFASYANQHYNLERVAAKLEAHPGFRVEAGKEIFKKIMGFYKVIGT